MDEIDVTIELTDQIEAAIELTDSLAATIELGTPGRDGAGAPLSKTAGQDLGGHRMVTLDDTGKAVYADCSVPSHENKVLGLTIGAALTNGVAMIATYGEVDEPSWTWTPGTPLFLGTSGMLYATPPTTGFSLNVGFAISATTIFLDIKNAITLL